MTTVRNLALSSVYSADNSVVKDSYGV
jgi:hypothetical protein